MSIKWGMQICSQSFHVFPGLFSGGDSSDLYLAGTPARSTGHLEAGMAKTIA